MTKSKNTKGLVGSNTYVDIDELTTLRADNKHLKRQLAEVRQENHKLEKIIQDFDGSVRYLMTVAPQLDNILKNNLLRLKEKGDE